MMNLVILLTLVLSLSTIVRAEEETAPVALEVSAVVEETLTPEEALLRKLAQEKAEAEAAQKAIQEQEAAQEEVAE